MTIIYSSTRNGGIGYKGQLVRTSTDDFKHFRKTTKGGILIMGRVTFEEINRALPGRILVVVSTTLNRELKNVSFVKSIEEAEDLARTLNRPIFVCGGEGIYKSLLPKATKIVHSIWHDRTIPADRFFNPNLNGWKRTNERIFTNFTLREYEKRNTFS